jgi:Kef-type K+ transport system membrane component KefB
MLTKVEILQYRLTSIGSGFLIPLFFITSGGEFDLPALVTSPASLARLVLFWGAFSSSAFFRFSCINTCSRSAICFRLRSFLLPRCRLSSR